MGPGLFCELDWFQTTKGLNFVLLGGVCYQTFSTKILDNTKILSKDYYGTFSFLVV